MKYKLALQAYDIQISHRSGKSNYLCDYISRYLEQPKSTISANEIVKIDTIQIGTILDEIRVEQQKVKEIKSIWKKMKKSKTPIIQINNKCFILKDDIVCLKTKTEPKIIIPYSMRRKIFQHIHEDPKINAHLAFEKTYTKMTKNFFWEGMHNDIKNLCSSCEKCQKRKILPNQRRPEPMALRPPPRSPFERVHIDVIGPLKKTKKENNKFILMMVDSLTKWTIATTLKEQTADEICCSILKRLICTFGVPNEIVTDNGRQFTSKEFRMFSTTTGFSHHLTSPYHHQSNGQVERPNRTIEEMLAMYTNNELDDWDQHLDEVTFALNTAINTTVKDSPFFLNFLRDPRLPSEAILRVEPKERNLERCFTHIREAWRRAAKLIKASQEKNKTIHDKTSVERDFKIGKLIVIWKHASTNKLKMKWKGPYRIIGIEKSHLTVQHLEDTTIKRINKDHVKHFNGPTILPFRKNDELIQKHYADPRIEESESEESDIDDTNYENEKEKQNEDKAPLHKHYQDQNLEQSDEEI